MGVIITSEISNSGPPPPAAATSAKTSAANEHRFGFHDLLSAMNPLQYLPVVGTIYRAVTGDVIPEAMRRIGSLVVSGLMGGPIGIGINVATTIAEKATGIDPEAIVRSQFKTTPAVKAAPPSDPPTAMPDPVATTPAAWTPSQLAAYGVRPDASGILKLGAVEGADVLNSIQLIELGRAAAAYAANQAVPVRSSISSG